MKEASEKVGLSQSSTLPKVKFTFKAQNEKKKRIHSSLLCQHVRLVGKFGEIFSDSGQQFQNKQGLNYRFSVEKERCIEYKKL